MAKTNSGLLEFKDDQKVLIALDDATSEVKKAVIIDADGTETDIAGGGGSVTVEALSVTENGTYSEEGKAYSPVTVNVAGGSGDFSTAEVTINKGEVGATVNCIIPWFSEEDNETSAFLTLDELTESWTVKVPVGGSFITVYFSRAPESISGDIEAGGDMPILSQTFKSYVITGDCTISFS